MQLGFAVILVLLPLCGAAQEMTPVQQRAFAEVRDLSQEALRLELENRWDEALTLRR